MTTVSDDNGVRTPPGIQPVTLVPWDPESAEHRERLYQQRVACGWKIDEVENWRLLQRRGLINLWWVVFLANTPSTAELLAKHIQMFPLEKDPILDSATAFSGKPRTSPRLASSFHPIGHISLDSYSLKATLADPAKRQFCITKFYISHALQRNGLGRAAMDAAEEFATAEPLRAKTLTLDTIAHEDATEEFFTAMGLEKPIISTEHWYARRGYVIYKRELNHYRAVDDKGNTLHAGVVFMKKSIDR